MRDVVQCHGGDLPYWFMRKRKTPPKTSSAAPSLAVALEANKDVKVRVEDAASDLASVGAVLENRVAQGNPEVAARVALKVSKEVQNKVEECADDLHTVNATLAQGLADLAQTESALAVAQEALADTTTALVSSQQAERVARLAASHDAATGLPNRASFDSRLTHDIAVAARHGLTLAVMFFDLDKFKTINDTHGHAAGDEVLKQVAVRLLEHCRLEDTVCRTGGDEFLYVLIDPKGRDNIERIAAGLVESLAQPVMFEGVRIVVRPSIGISLYPEQGASAAELIKNADTAMYVAKQAGASTGWAFYAG